MWNKMPQFKKNGFTILEVMIAIFVVTIGVLAAYNVTQQMISYTYHSASRLTAAYLAKEGIEIVRNTRDTNWLESAPSWNDGLSCATGCEADYNDPPPFNFYDDNHYLNIEAASGLYGYGPGGRTNFKRKITITPVGDTLKVSVEVQWKYKGKDYGPITAQENLYNWYPEII